MRVDGFVKQYLKRVQLLQWLLVQPWKCGAHIFIAYEQAPGKGRKKAEGVAGLSKSQLSTL